MSFTLSGVVQEMWLYHNSPEHDHDNSSWYILEIGPEVDEYMSFVDFIRLLDTYVHDPILPAPWCMPGNGGRSPYILINFPPTLTSISTAENIVIPAPPTPEHESPALYRHWNNERKAITVGASIVINFHIVYEMAYNGVIAPFVVSECLCVVQLGIPWYYLQVSGDTEYRRLIPAPLPVWPEDIDEDLDE
ncbi:hypothetical protein K435DRAFT_793965 [Dendrothele bispora CBS 962.96]|uniref:Uncharacterized protein n=1 Tax=Dendrothele bispora (strain CBS 962.96) TaxID=1314807 RepID=A0A4S8ME33_DENBC|nr:hypothetical protein K435DRAFT_793965 [Dendrothele bispora CBS 962.96]